MYKKLLIAVATSMIALSAFAVDNSKVQKSYELKDGSTLFVYKDGKMSMHDKMDRVQGMKEGQTMETKDGQKIMMKGNEVWRLEATHPY